MMLKNKTVSSIIMVIFGIVLIAWPKATIEILARIFGAALIVSGGIGVIQYFTKSEGKSLMKCVYNAILVIIGILILIYTTHVVSIIPFIIGVVIALVGAINSISVLQNKDSRTFKRDLILALVTLALGVIIFLNPFTTVKGLMIMVGISFVYIGLTRLVAGK